MVVETPHSAAQKRPGESQTGAAVAGGNDRDAGLGGARTGDGTMGLRRATAKRKGKKCEYQGLTLGWMDD